MVDAIALGKNTKLPASVCNLRHLTDFTSLRFFFAPVRSTSSIRWHIRVSTSNRARCNINRFHESIGSLGSLCRSLYRRHSRCASLHHEEALTLLSDCSHGKKTMYTRIFHVQLRRRFHFIFCHFSFFPFPFFLFLDRWYY